MPRMNDYQTFVFDIYDSWQAGLGILRLKIVDLSLNTSSKKRKTSCPFTCSKKVKQKRKSGQKISKKIRLEHQLLATKIPASSRGTSLHWTSKA